MTHSFDKDYWDQHWKGDRAGDPAAMAASPPHPHLVKEIDALTPGTALEAGCGAGAEAIWLAARGWDVTAVDIAEQALARAARRAADAGVADRVHALQGDADSLGDLVPPAGADLVLCHAVLEVVDDFDHLGESHRGEGGFGHTGR